ncbi:porin [Bradyrhizobium sp. STM 3843]|uniref:porin n=1 Tax=Bradyrhizobium sp. STM 3843 TaxID=551947 RepID=UPI0011124585|nr:porin [Bradyrhizobium sp. STM 3843]
MASIVGTRDPNSNIAQVGTTTRWTPVTRLAFSAELMWSRLDQNNWSIIALPAIGTKDAAVYAFKDLSTIVGACRIAYQFL